MNKLLFFHAPWCSGCRMQEPIIKELEKEFPDIKFFYINANEDEVNPEEFNIKNLPTLVLLKDNYEIDRIHGYHSKKEILKFIKQ